MLLELTFSFIVNFAVFLVLVDVDINDPEAFSMLDSPQMTSVIVKDIKYFTKQGGK